MEEKENTKSNNTGQFDITDENVIWMHKHFSSSKVLLPEELKKAINNHAMVNNHIIKNNKMVNNHKVSGKKTKMRNVPKLPGRLLPQPFDYIAVLDFEANCSGNQKRNHEIIEVPVIIVNTKTLEISEPFHSYVMPRFNKLISPFARDLTGITQDMIANGVDLYECLEMLNDWIKKEIPHGCSFTWLTCGDWDLKTMLPKASSDYGLQIDHHFRSWVNIKKTYGQVYGYSPSGMMGMLQDLKISHVGRHHSGIDDVRNIVNCVIFMLRQGVVFNQTTV